MVKLNTNLFKLLGALLVVILICKSCGAVTKYEEQNTYPNNQWRRNYKENDTKADSSSVSDRAERLGYTTGYGTQGYPYSGSGVGVYSPLKIDLGGVVIGALIGIGALLIVPKFLSAFNGGYGGSAGNYRSKQENNGNVAMIFDDILTGIIELGVDGDPTGLTDMLTKIDDVLGKNNIDSTTCVQRAVCTYVRSAEYHMTMGTADQSDQIIHTLTGNALVEYMLDGTAVKEALENGKNMEAKDCDTIYPGCPLDKQSSMQMLTKLLPKNGQ